MTHGPGQPPDPHRPPPWAAPGAQQPNPYPQGPYPQGPYPPAGGYGYPPPPKPGIIALRPLSLGDILDGTVKMIRSHPKATLGLSAIIGAVAALPVAIGDAIYFRELGGLFDPSAPSPTGEPSLPVGGMVAQYAGTAVSALITFVAVTLLTGLLTRVLGRAVFGGRITVGEAWRMTRARVWALLGLGLLVIVILALPGVLVGPLIAIGVAADLPALAVIGGVLALAWIVYVVFVATRLALAPVALVLERLGVVASMRRSSGLVKGDWWRVFGILLLTQVIIGVVGGVLSMPFALGSMALAFLGAGSVAAGAATAILLTLGQTLTATLTYPFTAGVTGLLYADRRMRAEGFDLTLQTAATQREQVPVDDLWRHTPAGPPRP
jgi:hypothetical protein